MTIALNVTGSYWRLIYKNLLNWCFPWVIYISQCQQQRDNSCSYNQFYRAVRSDCIFIVRNSILARNEKFIRTGASDLVIFYPIWVFFREHSWFTGQQEKWEAISLTPLYHFHPLPAENLSLHIARTQIWTGNRFPSASH